MRFSSASRMSGRRSRSEEGSPTGTSGACGCSVSFRPRGMSPRLFPRRMLMRSEERRVGKECRAGGGAYLNKKTIKTAVFEYPATHSSISHVSQQLTHHRHQSCDE